LLAPNEMAHPSEADVVNTLQSGTYADPFRAAFGGDVSDSTARAFQSALAALQVYELEDDDFHPYSSSFNLYTDNKIGGDLTPSDCAVSGSSSRGQEDRPFKLEVRALRGPKLSVPVTASTFPDSPTTPFLRGEQGTVQPGGKRVPPCRRRASSGTSGRDAIGDGHPNGPVAK
jgi:hypothetical protein